MQARNLQELNNRGAYDAVIRQFESGSVASSEASLGEYIKALARADRLDNSALLRLLQVRLQRFGGQHCSIQGLSHDMQAGQLLKE